MVSKSAGAKKGLDLILESALEQFAARGFEGVTLSDLARAAGLTNAGLLHYVSSKAELYRFVLEAAGRDLEERLDQALAAQTSPGARVSALMKAQRRWASERPAAVRLLMRELLDNAERVGEAHVFPLAKLLDTIEREVAGALAVRQDRRVAPLAVATMLIGSMAYAVAAQPTLARLKPTASDADAWLGQVTEAVHLILEGEDVAS